MVKISSSEHSKWGLKSSVIYFLKKDFKKDILKILKKAFGEIRKSSTAFAEVFELYDFG